MPEDECNVATAFYVLQLVRTHVGLHDQSLVCIGSAFYVVLCACTDVSKMCLYRCEQGSLVFCNVHGDGSCCGCESYHGGNTQF